MSRVSFGRGFWLLFSGAAASQAILILIAPIITRLYTPAALGEQAIFVATVSVLTVFATGRYELAIPLPAQQRDAAAVMTFGAGLCLLVSAAAAVLSASFHSALREAFKLSDVTIRLLPVAVLLSGLVQLAYQWRLRLRDYKRCSGSRFAYSSTTALGQLTGFPWGVAALQTAIVLGFAAQLITLAVQRGLQTAFPSLQAIKQAGRRYRHFALFSTWSVLLQTLSLQIPIFLLSGSFELAIAGNFALALRVLQTPTHLLGAALGQTFLAEAARQRELLPDMTRALYRRLTTIAIPVALIGSTLSGLLFPLLFGQEWRPAGMMAQWMAMWLASVLIGTPLSEVITLQEQPWRGLLFNGTLLLTRTAGLMVGIWREDWLLGVALMAILSTACWWGLIVWCMRAAGNPLWTLLEPGRSAGWWFALLGLALGVAYLSSWLQAVCGILLALTLLGYVIRVIKTEVSF
ncbi:MAG: oligosaccharide flippase family protein [Fimbriimonadales bacterium]|nr:oligosaccharide flippase family protein [Fimbriimonadales bacterium]